MKKKLMGERKKGRKARPLDGGHRRSRQNGSSESNFHVVKITLKSFVVLQKESV